MYREINIFFWFLTSSHYIIGGILSADINGELQLAAEMLEYGQGNWWNSARMIAHLKRVIEIRKQAFPWARVIWRFDHSSNHTAMADDALNPSKMNIEPGGAQPKMRDTVIQHACLLPIGTTQSMVFRYPIDICISIYKHIAEINVVHLIYIHMEMADMHK